ncbi:hypothetical protein [Streptomyces sp. NBC_01198]|uniref:hypothetical protein n=1 Tax=Streptomyces sp. NBC_01198 TaxID=2903769 RepID=UPI002E14E2BF|nr:hypothetical protein OG702_03095 [Streptomyces sp. NBC_01198]
MTQPPSTPAPQPVPVAGEPNPGTRRWGQRLYLIGAVVYVAGITVALLAGHPAGRSVAWAVAWAAILLCSGGAALLLLRRHKATAAAEAAGRAGRTD